MSHLLKITADRKVETIAWNDEEDSLSQLYRALSTDSIAVDMVEPAPHDRGEHITVWADEDGWNHNSPANLYGTAYTGEPLRGTIAVTAWNPRTGETFGLTDEQLREEEDFLIRAVAVFIARLGALRDPASA